MEHFLRVDKSFQTDVQGRKQHHLHETEKRGIRKIIKHTHETTKEGKNDHPPW